MVPKTQLELTELEWQRQVLDLAELYGWLVYHTYDSRRSQPGFPDLVLLRAPADRHPELLFVELKRAKGRVRPEQKAWIAGLVRIGRAAPAVECHVWRPQQFDEVHARLRRKSGEIPA